MKKLQIFLFSLILLSSINSHALDVTISFIPAASSVTDVKVNDLSQGKVTGLQTIISAAAKTTDAGALLKTSDLLPYAKMSDTTVVTPPGTVQIFAGTTAPSGWLLTQGQTVLTTDYPALFTAIGYTYGGSGTSFTLPNNQGMFIRGTGYQSWGGIGYSGTLGQRQNDQMQGHAHNVRIGGDGYVAGGTSAQRTSNTATPGTTYNYIDDGHGAPRMGYENQPANISMNYMIKY